MIKTKTESIDKKTYNNKHIQIKEVEKIEKVSPIEEQRNKDDQNKKDKQLKEQKQSLKKQQERTTQKITSQQAYEMQKSKSSLKAQIMFKSEKEKVKKFKSEMSVRTGCAKYEKHLDDVVNMPRMANYTQRNQQIDKGR